MSKKRPDRSAEVSAGALGLLGLLWVGSCAFGADAPQQSTEQVAQGDNGQAQLEARRSADIARFPNDPLITESARKSPSGDGVAYAISALGGRCEQAISVTPLKTPMTYEVICSDGMAGTHMNFVKYRLNTAAGISELLS